MTENHLVKIKPQKLEVPMNQPKFATELLGTVLTVSAAPTHVPRNFLDQFRIYTNGATLRFYWYDITNATWHYVTATA